MTDKTSMENVSVVRVTNFKTSLICMSCEGSMVCSADSSGSVRCEKCGDIAMNK